MSVAIQPRHNLRPPMVKMTFLNADVYPPVPETLEIPDHLVDAYRNVVYISDDPFAYMDSYPDDWLDDDDDEDY